MDFYPMSHCLVCKNRLLQIRAMSHAQTCMSPACKRHFSGLDSAYKWLFSGKITVGLNFFASSKSMSA